MDYNKKGLNYILVCLIIISFGLGILTHVIFKGEPLQEPIPTQVITPCIVDIFTAGLEKAENEDTGKFMQRVRGAIDCFQEHYIVYHAEPVINVVDGQPDIFGYIIFYMTNEKFQQNLEKKELPSASIMKTPNMSWTIPEEIKVER